MACPSCKKTFSAVEVQRRIRDDEDDDDGGGVGVRVRSKAAARAGASPKKAERPAAASNRKGSVKGRDLDDGDESEDDENDEDDTGSNVSVRVRFKAAATPKKKMTGQSSNERGTASSRKGRVQGHNVDEDDDDGVRSRGTARVRAKVSLEKRMRRSSGEKSTAPSRKGKNKGQDLGDDEMENDGDDVLLLEWLPSEKMSCQKRKINDLGRSHSKKKADRSREKTLAEMQLEVKRKLESKKVKKEVETEKAVVPVSMDSNSMSVEDADFYDFDKDRVERSFKQGQVWAVYDDDDGMPRHYGLIDEVVSVNPFLLKMSWLDLQNSGDGALISWEKQGFHISCGRFKVGRKVDIDSVNCFSHLLECERAAREIYRIYPKKGSVWALYTEDVVEGGWGSSAHRERRSYDIVVFLTSYSEMYGLSMAYLEKVEGFKTIFKRREIGCHAIRWLEKDDVRLFSHQIPARKISGEEASDLPKDSWELDPASLPSDMLRIV